MAIQRLNLNADQKSEIESLIGRKIYLRNSFTQNQKEIQGLVEQGLHNSQVYLDRNYLGQKLSLFDENQVFGSVVNLGKFLQLPKIPRRIECYDISHLQGKFVYGSMVVFIDGRPVNKYYRLFKCKEQNNDFENHREVLARRLRRGLSNLNSAQGFKLDPAWTLPDLIIVDGGKGQLSSDYSILQNFELTNQVAMVSIAKREEEIFGTDMTNFANYSLGQQGGLLLEGELKFLCQRIRDEAHRFAIKNNRLARLRTVQKSQMDDIEGIGPKTKQKLMLEFISLQNLVTNMYDNPEFVIELVGESTFNKLKAKFLV
jgi:excinuclease ABC subunit C